MFEKAARVGRNRAANCAECLPLNRARERMAPDGFFALTSRLAEHIFEHLYSGFSMGVSRSMQ